MFLNPFKSNSNLTVQVQDFPQEVLLYIFAYLEPVELCSIALVCRQWCALSEDQYLWRRFLPETLEDNPKALYIDIMRHEMQKYKQTNALPWLQDKSIILKFPLDNARVERKKVIILGADGVGKTAFASVFTRNGFPAHCKPTIGSDLLSCSLRKGRIQLWDVSGVSTPGPSLFRYTDAVMLLFDLSKPKTVDQMIRMMTDCVKLDSFTDTGSSLMYMVLGCKSDLIDADSEKHQEFWEELRWRCLEVAPVAGFFCVSAKQGQGIRTVRGKIAEWLFAGCDDVDPYDGRIYLPDKATWLRMAAGGIRSRPASSNLGCTIQ